MGLLFWKFTRDCSLHQTFRTAQTIRQHIPKFLRFKVSEHLEADRYEIEGPGVQDFEVCRGERRRSERRLHRTVAI